MNKKSWKLPVILSVVFLVFNFVLCSTVANLEDQLDSRSQSLERYIKDSNALLNATNVEDQALGESNYVLIAYDQLKENFYDPSLLDITRLLNSALKGAAEELKKENVEFAPTAIPDGTDLVEAQKHFRREYKRAKELHSAGHGWFNRQLAFASLAAMLGSVNDSHTYFMDPESLRDRDSNFNNEASYAGIGAAFKKLEDGFYYIEWAFPDRPAAKAGIKRFDRLLMVDGRPLPNSLEQIAHAIRGPPGTKVVIGVERGGEQKTFEVVREAIKPLHTALNFIQQDGKKIAIFSIYTFMFSLDVDPEVQNNLAILDKEKPDGIILELRGNGGGSLLSLRYVLGWFFKRGTMLCYGERQGERRYEYAMEFGRITETPLVVLINEHCASAAEIAPGAFKDHGRAKLVGKKTSGHTGIGVTVGLGYGSAMLVTVAAVYTPKGQPIEGNGIAPDIGVDLTKENIKAGKDVQLEKAIEELLKIIS